MELRLGSQTPTTSRVLPYTTTEGQKAIDLYNTTTRTAREWQELLIYDILSVNEDGLWTHSKFGYEIPRRNGKGEVLVIRELYGLQEGERIIHTAHRTTTSHAAWERLCQMLDECGIEYKSTKQYGLETVRLDSGACVNFRTRSSKGGLGEGYDLLVIDEAQEYTIDQESALKYVVTDSMNPQTIFCGTPPTATSSGTVFVKMRDDVLQGTMQNAGWAEWSVDQMSDPNDRELWYKTNPSLGQGLTERAVADEITSDDVDFNIQRLGLWLRYNQKSAISRNEWESMQVKKLPKLTGRLFVGIKYGHDGKNVAMSIAVKTEEGKTFVESIDCKSVSAGNLWIIKFLREADVQAVIIDGANGQQLLADDMRDAKLISPVLPTVKDVIVANAAFEQAVFQKALQHAGQPSLAQVVANCEKRAIGSNGGFGYRSIKENADIALMDSVILAHWAAGTCKEKKPQKVSY